MMTRKCTKGPHRWIIKHLSKEDINISNGNDPWYAQYKHDMMNHYIYCFDYAFRFATGNIYPHIYITYTIEHDHLLLFLNISFS